MSREQIAEQQAQQDLELQQPSTSQETWGLPPGVYAQVMALRPGDVVGLAGLLQFFADMEDQILAAASAHVGLSTVKQAQEWRARTQGAPLQQSTEDREEMLGGLEGSSEPTRAPSSNLNGVAPSPEAQKLEDAANLEGDEVSLPPALRQEVMALRPGDADALAQLVGAQPQQVISEILLFARQQGFSSAAITETLEIHKRQTAPPEPKSKMLLSQEDLRPGGEWELDDTPSKKEVVVPEPAWAVEARKYNEAHPELADEFSLLTDYFCEQGGKIDAQAVRDWQKAHGLEADGKIGPKTLAAAREKKTTGSMVADGPQAAGEGIPV